MQSAFNFANIQVLYIFLVDISHTFLSLTVTKLQTLENSPVFGPPCSIYRVKRDRSAMDACFSSFSCCSYRQCIYKYNSRLDEQHTLLKVWFVRST